MPFLRLDEHDATIRWHDIGTDRPVAVLAGLSLPVIESFLHAATHPAFRDRRFVMIDMLGSGHSDHPVDFDYSIAGHAATVARVLDHLGLREIDFLGHSMGGTVAIQLARDRPDLVARLAVSEANLVPGGGIASTAIAAQGRAAFLDNGYRALLADLRAEVRGGAVGLDRVVSGWSRADPAGIFGNAKALVDLSPDFEPAFLAMKLPRAFIYGARSLEGPSRGDLPDPARLARHGVVPLVVPDAGHGMMEDNPDGFVDAVRQALA